MKQRLKKIADKPLGDIASFKSGGTPSKKKPQYWGGGVPWVSAKDLKSSVVSSSIDTLTEEGRMHGKIAPKDSLLVLVRGMTLYKDVPIALAGRDLAFNQDIKALVLKNGVNAEYLLYFLKYHKPALMRLVNTAGHVTGRLDTDALKDFPVSLPNLEEQKKLAEIFLAWDTTIEKTEALIAAKERQMEWLSRKLIHDPVHPRSHVRECVAEVSRRNRDLACTRVLSVTNHSGFILPEDQFERRVASENLSNYKIVQHGHYAYNPSRINVGSIARLDDWEDGALSPMYVVFRVKDNKIDSDFFQHWLASGEARQRIRKSAQGSVRETVSFKDLGAVPIPLPPLPEQQRIAHILNTAAEEMHEEADGEEPIDLFKNDGFGKEEPEDDYIIWKNEDHTRDQRVFYLHGAVHLYERGAELEKYTWINRGKPLIEQAREALTNNMFPLFVAEGRHWHKLQKIKHDPYLHHCYKSFRKMVDRRESLFLFGHSLDNNDDHILKRLAKGKCPQVFISLFGDQNLPNNQKIITKATGLANLRAARYPLGVNFYDAASAEVWG